MLELNIFIHLPTYGRKRAFIYILNSTIVRVRKKRQADLKIKQVLAHSGLKNAWKAVF